MTTDRIRFKEVVMNPIRILAIVLIVAGVLGLVYGSFSYTKETHEAKLGPLELSVKEKETVNVPQWAGIGAIAIGAILLLVKTGGRQ
jgi:multidrug transporter EmrE-like cation transporter